MTAAAVPEPGAAAGAAPGAAPAPAWVNVGCGQFRAKAPWWNVDVAASPPNTTAGTYPDQVIDPHEPPGSAFTGLHRAYFGHLLEHMPAEDVLVFLAGWRAALAPGAEVCVVGPDVNRALRDYATGRLDRAGLWQRMEPGMHHDDVAGWVAHYAAGLHLHPGYHRWNCTPQRAQALLELTGYTGIREVAIGSRELDSWPLVSRSTDQFAVLAAAPPTAPAAAPVGSL